jgi:hypothetical protein
MPAATLILYIYKDLAPVFLLMFCRAILALLMLPETRFARPEEPAIFLLQAPVSSPTSLQAHVTARQHRGSSEVVVHGRQHLLKADGSSRARQRDEGVRTRISTPTWVSPEVVPTKKKGQVGGARRCRRQPRGRKYHIYKISVIFFFRDQNGGASPEVESTTCARYRLYSLFATKTETQYQYRQ